MATAPLLGIRDETSDQAIEYRHLHAVGGVRLAAGGFQLGVGLVWSLWVVKRKLTESGILLRVGNVFLGMAALQSLGGYMDITSPVPSGDRLPSHRSERAVN